MLPALPATQRLRRLAWLSAGSLLFALGAAGLFLPLFPTVVFWLGAVACFGKSHPVLEQRLLNHPRWGRTLRDYREHGVISRQGKRAAVLSMLLSALVSILLAHSLLVSVLVLGILGGVAAYIVTRPDRVPTTASHSVRALPS